MKQANTLFWIFTSLFGGFMMFSAIPDIMVVPEAVEMVSKQLGYPQYIIPFLGIAKALGVIAILIPGYRRIKEWAYAGLCFDLIGATYSAVMTYGFAPDQLFMVLPFAVGALSYIYHHKRLSPEISDL